MSYFWLLLGFVAGLVIAAIALSGALRLQPARSRIGPHKKAIDAALARLTSGDHRAAANSLRRAAELESGDDVHYLLLGEELRAAGDVSRAEKVADLLLARRVAEPEVRSGAWLLKGRLLEARHEHERALEAFAKAIDAEPDAIAPLVAQGRLQSRLGRWSEAIESGEKLTRLDRDRGQLITSRRLALLARELVAEGHAKDALRAAQRAVELTPDLAAAQMTLGDASLQLGDVSGAIEAWKRSATLARWLAPAVLDRLEQVHRNSGDREGVRRFAREACEQDEGDEPPWRLYAWLADEAIRLDAIEEARQWSERLERAAPTSSTAQRLRSRLAAAEDGMRAGPRLLALLARWENEPAWIDPWRCRVCGHEPEQLEWRCAKCQAWESLR